MPQLEHGPSGIRSVDWCPHESRSFDRGSRLMSKRGWPHVDDPFAVGTRLKEARLAAGLSQRELSFQGCTAVYICRIERGDRVPSLQVLRELARRAGVDEEWLATGASRVEAVD